MIWLIIVGWLWLSYAICRSILQEDIRDTGKISDDALWWLLVAFVGAPLNCLYFVFTDPRNFFNNLFLGIPRYVTDRVNIRLPRPHIEAYRVKTIVGKIFFIKEPK